MDMYKLKTAVDYLYEKGCVRADVKQSEDSSTVVLFADDSFGNSYEVTVLNTRGDLIVYTTTRTRINSTKEE